MKTIRVLLLSSLLLSSSAFANTFTTDMTDLWWNANESGWGVTVTAQGDVVFLTFFVYNSDNKPTFYTASALYTSTTSQGALVFSGPMYQTTGPWFGTSFNPNAVGVRQVGTATFTAFISSATLAYNVDGVPVTKALTRQTFRNNDLTGQYVGVIRQRTAGCTDPFNNGTAEITVGVSIANSVTSFSMITNDGAEVCTYSGNYSQAGRIGRSQGNYSCPGRSGTYDFFELEAPWFGATGRFSVNNSLCSQVTGSFAGVRRQ